MSEYIKKFMIDALKRHPQCEDVYKCLVFKEIRILSCGVLTKWLKRSSKHSMDTVAKERLACCLVTEHVTEDGDRHSFAPHL